MFTRRCAVLFLFGAPNVDWITLFRCTHTHVHANNTKSIRISAPLGKESALMWGLMAQKWMKKETANISHFVSNIYVQIQPKDVGSVWEDWNWYLRPSLNRAIILNFPHVRLKNVCERFKDVDGTRAIVDMFVIIMMTLQRDRHGTFK